MGMFDNWWEGVKHRVTHPTETLATALREQLPTEDNILGGFVGIGGLTKGLPIYRGTKRIPDLTEVSRRLKHPGSEFGMHVSIDPNTADLMQYNYVGSGGKGGIISMKSNVDKPLTLPDTGGNWRPDLIVDSIFKNPSKITGATLEKINVGTEKSPTWISNYVLPKKFEDDLLNFKKEYNETLYKHGETQEIIDTQAKKLQEILKKHGFDHISYINTREGKPVESAILFDDLSFKDPFLDTTR